MSASGLTGLTIESIDATRFDAALEFFKEGKTIEFEKTIFVLDPGAGRLQVTKLATKGIENVDTDAASAEISRAMEVYEYIREGSPQFARITAGFIPRFSVVHDYGTGSVEICHLHHGKLVWKT